MSMRTARFRSRRIVPWRRTTVTLGAMAALVALMGAVPTGHASLSVEDPHLGIGKVDPGHTATFTRIVHNTGDTSSDIELSIHCPCTPHLSVTPQAFTLGAGQSREVTVALAVPDDAEPGVHDARIKVVERATTTAGGTGQSAVDIVANYQVRTAAIYMDPVSDPTRLTGRIVNAYNATLAVTLQPVLHTEPSRTLDAIDLQADGSTNGSRVTRFEVPVTWTGADPEGLYEATITATWSNAAEGVPVGSDAATVTIGWGVPQPHEDDGSGGTAEGAGGAGNGAPVGDDLDGAGRAEAASSSVPSWLLIAGAALVVGIAAGVMLGRRGTR